MIKEKKSGRLVERTGAYEILSELSRGTRTFTDLLRLLPKTTLVARLRELVDVRYVARREVYRGRPRVEYSITSLGVRALRNYLVERAPRILEDCARLLDRGDVLRIVLSAKPLRARVRKVTGRGVG